VDKARSASVPRQTPFCGTGSKNRSVAQQFKPQLHSLVERQAVKSTRSASFRRNIKSKLSGGSAHAPMLLLQPKPDSAP
jgi:hypothetical protein